MAKKNDEKEETDTSESGGGSKRKKLVIVMVPVLLLLAGAGWWLFLREDESGAPEALPEPTPGEVVKLDPITINLAGAHYLKLGMALQPTATATELDGSEALDLAIAQFSQMTIGELSTAKGRSKAKEELVARIKLTYLPEGTDLAAATSAEHEGEAEDEAEHEDEAATTEDSENETTTETEKEEIDIDELSTEEVIKLADSLTVQPNIYDLYFTEFVMQ